MFAFQGNKDKDGYTEVFEGACVPPPLIGIAIVGAGA